MNNKVLYEERPYAWRINFEGTITIPVESEELALIEVRKALQKMIEPYDVYEEPGKVPEWGCWSKDCFIHLIETKEEMNKLDMLE